MSSPQQGSAASIDRADAARRTLGILCATLTLVALLPGCGAAEQAPAAEPAALATTGFHTRYGFPGPWSREGASHTEFDADSRACLGRSNEARRSASDDRNDAAYRSFLECMDERGWTRGVAPKASAAAERRQAPDAGRLGSDT